MEKISTIEILKNSNFIVKENRNLLILNRKYRKPLILPRFINLDMEFLKALYIVWGDGSYKQKFFFANKEPDLHKYIITNFEKYLKIPKTLWRLRILHSSYDNKKVANSIKNKWLKILNFEQYQLYQKVCNTGYLSNINGNARIIIDKLNYGELINYLLKYFNILIENKILNEKQLVAVLDGILNAEGSALIDYKGLHKIVITPNKKEVKFIRKVLSQLYIEDLFVERNNKLVITSWKKLYRFMRIFARNNICPFEIHPIRRKNALSGFLKHRRTVALYNYLLAIEKNQGLSLRELSRMAKRDPSSVKITIFKRVNEFTKIKGGRPYKIYLSEEGKEFLRVMRKLILWFNSFQKSGGMPNEGFN